MCRVIYSAIVQMNARENNVLIKDIVKVLRVEVVARRNIKFLYEIVLFLFFFFFQEDEKSFRLCS